MAVVELDTGSVDDLVRQVVELRRGLPGHSVLWYRGLSCVNPTERAERLGLAATISPRHSQACARARRAAGNE
jgi:hypothetical protein